MAHAEQQTPTRLQVRPLNPAFDPREGRVLHRTTIVGDSPVLAA